MRVLFVYPDYPLREVGLRVRRLGFYSEGIGVLSAVLKGKGHTVKLYHMTVPARRREVIGAVREADPDMIGFSVRTSNFGDVPNYVRWAREAAPRAVIVAGGYHATVDPEGTLREGGFDFVIRGEAEESLPALCEAVEGRRKLEEVGGLCRLVGGEMVANPNGPLIRDLELLPVPDFSIFDPANLETSPVKTLPVIVSRGCPYSCFYCCNSTFRSIYPNPHEYVRFREPEKAIAYMKRVMEAYGEARYVSFFDDILPLNHAWLRSFLELYRKEIGLPFSCNARPDLLTEEIVALLRDAGCYRIHMGIESGDEEIRELVRMRRISTEAIVCGFELCKKAGISCLSYNMVGLPGENLRRIVKTMKLNARIAPHRVLASVFYPYPGTYGYRLALEKGYLRDVHPWKGRWVLGQKELTADEARFASAYFRVFTQAYRWASSLPPVLGRGVEKALDGVFCFRYKPHRLLVWVARVSVAYVEIALMLTRRYLSGFYLRVRNHTLVRSARAGAPAGARR